MVTAFSVTDQVNRVKFFEEIFRVASVNPNVVLRMPFLILSGVDVNFLKKKLWWRSYIIEEAFPTIKRVKLVGKKEFATAALDLGHKIFIVCIASLESPSNNQDGDVYFFHKTQIVALIVNEASILIPTEYSDFTDVFSLELASELFKHTRINNRAIKLVDNWQPPYGPIYSLGSVELKTLKTYIETNLASNFIILSKSLARAPIFFDKKSDGSFRLCIDYWRLSNLTIKNRYLLLFVGKSLDWLRQARRFSQLNFTNAYHRIRIHERNEWKPTFRTRYNHFEYQIIPFGLINTSETFQGYINKILAEKLDVFVIVYLDDILI